MGDGAVERHHEIQVLHDGGCVEERAITRIDAAQVGNRPGRGSIL
jgi:hypothetical protein